MGDHSSTEKEAVDREKGLVEAPPQKLGFKARICSLFYRILPRHRLPLSIRTQLIALVLFVALFSLLTLAVVTGTYFSNILTHTRATKLEVEAQLKAAQMQQGFYYYYYQASLLSSKDSIQTAMTNRNAGNTSSAVTAGAESAIQQFLDSTSLFNGARLYDPSFMLIAEINGTMPNVSEYSVLERLYVLSYLDDAGPPDILAQEDGLIWGPVLIDGEYFASFTIPVDTNSTFLLEERGLAGYLTMIMNVTSLESASYNTSSSGEETARFFKPISSTDNISDFTGFSYVFEPEENAGIDTVYPLDVYKPLESVFTEGATIGYMLDVKNPLGNKVSVGYAAINFTYGLWAVVLEQNESHFMQPISKLAKLMVGVCIAISALMCFITFLLAHYSVRPILRLQKATEAITEGRGLHTRRKHRRRGFHFHDYRRDKGPAAMAATAALATGASTTTTSGAPPSSSLSISQISHTPAITPPPNAGASQQAKANSQLCHRTSCSRPESYVFHNFSSGSIISGGENRSGQGSEGFLDSSPATDISIDADYSHTPPLPAIVPTKGIFYDELTELTEAFNTMTEELDKQYAHLEDRVRARTKELEIAKIQADSARQQAEAANEAKTVFIANISHELRTPLNGILGMTSIAMAEKESKKIQSSLELIFRSGELLLHILTQLLTFSKNQLDKSKPQKKNFMIIEVASQIKSIFDKTAKDQDVDLVIQIKPNLSREMILLGDSNRIIQVVMNLVSNSLKFTPENGTVKVIIKVLGEYDRTRSKAAKYEHVYVKGLEEAPEDRVPHHPKTLRARFSSSSNLSLKSASEYSIATLTPAQYHSELAEAYNFDHSEKQYFDEEEDTFIGKEMPDSSVVRRFHECYKFKDTRRYWVLRMSVSDTGTGIDDSLQEKIFEAFVQGDQTLSRSHGGTGLGLSICKQFARLMHGTLTLKSRVNEGSTFTFTIPLPQVGEIILGEDERMLLYDDEFNPQHPRSKKVSFADEQKSDGDYGHVVATGARMAADSFVKADLITRASTGTARSRMSNEVPGSVSSDEDDENSSSSSMPSEVADPAKAKLRFLVVEDNLVNQEVVKRMMKLEGYTEVTLACDGYEAIDLVKRAEISGKPFDLVLMDVQMPKMDGISATRILRHDMAYPGPIVALTAFADKSNEDECTEVGMSGFLSKPVRRSLLRGIIERFCGDKVVQDDEQSRTDTENDDTDTETSQLTS
ncbi:hypothetical protein FOA43_004503 [Brettanomyces nanus]|uniref:histidine kinase n=1 Tax=Eeniella nana TaxID=13502 RepID=A0A875RQI7_EENNA|nr:uncharacterized protein FOA43_004503 [Brettanomyces nanus]QPG77100.1 hypothetical protein FOA43_004503 [Brettanomyces nanus]